jgi:hypothetical protein
LAALRAPHHPVASSIDKRNKARTSINELYDTSSPDGHSLENHNGAIGGEQSRSQSFVANQLNRTVEQRVFQSMKRAVDDQILSARKQQISDFPPSDCSGLRSKRIDQGYPGQGPDNRCHPVHDPRSIKLKNERRSLGRDTERQEPRESLWITKEAC